MATDDVIVMIRQKYQILLPSMDERMRRLWAATEAQALGWGGIARVAQATGLARNTITAGLRDLQRPLPAGHIRRPGGGPKPLTQTDPLLEQAVDRLIDPLTRGHPQSPLRWTCKSTRLLAEELTKQGHPIGARTVAALLHQAGYSLQGCRKNKEGSSHPDRNAQFLFIHDQVQRLQRRGQPVISVDTKKKELVGDYKNTGQEWQPAGEPEEVRVHDFPNREFGKAVPYGVYDLSNNEGWVSVGINHDTAQFAVASIGRWWNEMGQKRFPRASEVLITADGGGSNAYKNRLWKVSLQRLADETGLKIHVSHLPPGTSKWNKIEHRLFCHITTNWRGRPLTSYEVIVNLIANTTTSTGLIVRAALDAEHYETGIEVSDEELARVNLKPKRFHGEWNYTIMPRR